MNNKDESEKDETIDESVMALQVKLDLGLAIKLVDKYDGDSTKLSNFLENVELLQTYSAGVPVADIINFTKTRLIGPAHGAIEGAATLAQVAEKLREKFGVKITPKAIENEMLTLKQGKKTITDYGNEMSELAAKLAAAHVSQGTFPNEASAAAIVQPIAVNAFTTGLRDGQTSFFIKARNPTNLTKAISDALEVAPIPATTSENALWIGTNRKFSDSPHTNYRRTASFDTFPRKYGNKRRNFTNFTNRNKRNTNYDRYNRNFSYNDRNYYQNKNFNQENRSYSSRNRRNQANYASCPDNVSDNQRTMTENEDNPLDLFRPINKSSD